MNIDGEAKRGIVAELLEQEEGGEDRKASVQTHNSTEKSLTWPIGHYVCVCVCLDLCHLYLKVYFDVLIHQFSKSFSISLKLIDVTSY